MPREVSETCLNKSSNTNKMEPGMMHNLEDMCTLGGYSNRENIPGKKENSVANGPKDAASSAVSNRGWRRAVDDDSGQQASDDKVPPGSICLGVGCSASS